MKTHIFNNINELELKSMLNCFNARTLNFSKNSTILSNMAKTNEVGVINKGSAQIIRYNYNGTRTIIEKLNEGDIYGSFASSVSEDLYVISAEETEVITFSYEKLVNRCKKNCCYHNQLINNLVQKLAQRQQSLNERIEILTKKTIRDKLLAYFESLSEKQINKTIHLPFTLTELADYLSIDRSAMMREIKNLKEEGLIESKGKKICLLY